MGTQFTNLLSRLRLKKGVSLRQFAKSVGLQPSNYCNVEAGSLPPPSGTTVEKMAGELGLEKGTTSYQQFLDLAAKARDEIPADVERIVRERDAIPGLLRTIDNSKISDVKLRELMERIKSGKY